MDFKSKASTVFIGMEAFKIPVIIVSAIAVFCAFGIERQYAIKEAVNDYRESSETKILDEKVKLRKQVFQKIGEDGKNLESKKKEVESLEKSVETLTAKLAEVDAQIVSEVNRISLKK